MEWPSFCSIAYWLCGAPLPPPPSPFIELCCTQVDAPDSALLMPVLRCLGNLFATSLPPEVLPELGRGEGPLRRLLQAACSHQHGVQKEALWVLSNFSALHTHDRYLFQRDPTTFQGCINQHLD